MLVWSQRDIHDHLFAIADARAGAAGRKVQANARLLLGDLFKAASTELAIQTDLEAQSTEIAQAAVDVVQLIEAMIRAAELIPEYPRDVLGEKTFDRVRNWFCPRRPFCK